MNTCAQDGCNARCVAPHDRCARHRPKPVRPRYGQRQESPAEKKLRRQRKLLRGLPPGFEGVW